MICLNKHAVSRQNRVKEKKKWQRKFVYCSWPTTVQTNNRFPQSTWGVSFSAILMAAQSPRQRLNVDATFLIFLGNTPLNLIWAISADCEITRLHIKVWPGLASMLMLSRFMSFVLRKVTAWKLTVCVTLRLIQKRKVTIQIRATSVLRSLHLYCIPFN